MKKTVRRYIREHGLLRNSDPVVVGVSGGVDSMSLLHVLNELGYAVLAVHFNHELRATESDGDAGCVTNFCSALNIPLVHVRLGEKAQRIVSIRLHPGRFSETSVCSP